MGRQWAGNEPATGQQRAGNEPATNRQRVGEVLATGWQRAGNGSAMSWQRTGFGAATSRQRNGNESATSRQQAGNGLATGRQWVGNESATSWQWAGLLRRWECLFWMCRAEPDEQLFISQGLRADRVSRGGASDMSPRSWREPAAPDTGRKRTHDGHAAESRGSRKGTRSNSKCDYYVVVLVLILWTPHCRSDGSDLNILARRARTQANLTEASKGLRPGATAPPETKRSTSNVTTSRSVFTTRAISSNSVHSVPKTEEVRCVSSMETC